MIRYLFSAICLTGMAIAAPASAQSQFVSVNGTPTSSDINFGATAFEFTFPQFNDALAGINFAQLVGVRITYTAEYSLSGSATNNTSQNGTVQMAWNTTTTFSFDGNTFQAFANNSDVTSIEDIIVGQTVNFGPFEFDPEGTAATSNQDTLNFFTGNGTSSGFFTSTNFIGYNVTGAGGTGTFDTSQFSSQVTVTPTITYEFVPEPGVALLSLLGGLGLVFMRRRIA